MTQTLERAADTRPAVAESWLVLGIEQDFHNAQALDVTAWRFENKGDAELWREARSIVMTTFTENVRGLDEVYEIVPLFVVIGPVPAGVVVQGKTPDLEDVGGEHWSDWYENPDGSWVHETDAAEEALEADVHIGNWRALCQAIIRESEQQP